ncbi:hypothetical protein EJ05DRAFT_477235 [Pseudovirgaria hyperparasitica]|uniref:Methyltransferase type 11 domain-containing protein n=1 Tax=Pseudovirgaria hyperparasitica TaxID=470096 RepID=A0A6A6W4P8_9PEZI|nr:uncharacterized protein EJ05DRAFT_477235 [Pseudovirgaria hyperparasitica]KAF2757014.1 hypothetical protein EJ05DRAFT_477235 [Pseudovirgaria hyperparasitica]
MFPTFDHPQVQTIGQHRRKRSIEKNAKRSSTGGSSLSTSSSTSGAAAGQHSFLPGLSTGKKKAEKSSGFAGFLKSREKRAQSLKDFRTPDHETKPLPEFCSEFRSEFRPTGRVEQEALRQSLETLRLDPDVSSEDEREIYAINRTGKLPAQKQLPSSRRLPPIPGTKPNGSSAAPLGNQHESAGRLGLNRQIYNDVPRRGPSIRSGTSDATSKSGASAVFDPIYSEDSKEISPISAYSDTERYHREREFPSPNDSMHKRVLQGEWPRGRSYTTNGSLGSRVPHRDDAVESSVSRTLSRMETAGLKIIATRLSEEWDFDRYHKDYHEIEFEKKLWALTAYSWLTQGKQIQSPTHELLLSSGRSEGRKILLVNGDLATGWVLAAKYPNCNVYTLCSANSTPTPPTHSPPSNHHSLYISPSATNFPFPDCYFDSVVSRTMLTAVTHGDLSRCLRDCMRVLKPGCRLEIVSVEANLMRSGPFTSVWIDDHIMTPLQRNGYSTDPTEQIRHALTFGALYTPKQVRIALPVVVPRTISGPVQNTASLMTVLGQYLYQTAFGQWTEDFGVQSWFWMRADMRSECERMGSNFAVTITVAEKP